MTDTAAETRWGPTQQGGRRRSRWKTLLRVLLLMVLVIVGFGLATAFYASSRIERVDVASLMRGGGPLNILVVGSDSRADLTPKQRRELRTGSAQGERTDTIFVMQVSGGDVAMLAFPRDLYVDRCDGSRGRINAAMAIDGPGCLVETITDLSGIPIDDYLEVRFLGFRDIVNAVGGVEICLDKPIQDADAGIDLPAGCQVLDGRDALGYVRVRKIDSDLERIKRQQQFLGRLADEILAPETVFNPVRLFRTAGEVGSALRADEGLGIIDLGRIAWGMRGLAGGEAAFHTVPATGADAGGASVLVPKEGEAEQLFAAFRNGSILGTGGRSIEPADVSVRVLNGAGVSGLAGQTAERLQTAGFVVEGIGNAEAMERTTILYPVGAEDQARFLGEQFAAETSVEPDVSESSEVGVITLVLGSDLAPD